MDFQFRIEKLLTLNSQILIIWTNLEKELIQKGMNFSRVSRLILKNKKLSVFFENERVEKINFTEFFSKIKNLFMDDLPSDKYFDLKSSILKYKGLNPHCLEEIITSWDMVLNNVYDYLKGFEEKIKENCFDSFLKSLDLLERKDQSWVLVEKNNYFQNIEFDIIIEKKYMDNTNSLISILKDNFSFKSRKKNSFKSSKYIDLSRNENYKTYIFPNPPSTNTYGRGYKIYLKTPILCVGFSVKMILNGELEIFFIDQTSKIKHRVSKKNINTNDKQEWISIEFKEIKIENEDSLIIKYEGIGSFVYKDGDINHRKINDKIDVISKFSTEIKNKNVSETVAILDNSYSLELKIFIIE